MKVLTKADSDFLRKANDFAMKKHLGQVRDDGKDYYISHLLQTQMLVMLVSDDIEVMVASVLHDTLEDTETSYQELVYNFGIRVADLVNEVTDEGIADNYGKYFPRLKTKEGILIKFCDRISNISNMDAWDEDRQKHYLKKSKFWKDGSDRE